MVRIHLGSHMNLLNSSPVRFIYSFFIGYVVGISSFYLFVKLNEYLLKYNPDFSRQSLSAIAAFFGLIVPYIISLITLKTYRYKGNNDLSFLRLYFPQIILLPIAWFIAVWYWGLITNKPLEISFSMSIELILLHHLIAFCLLLLPIYLINIPRQR